MVLPSPPHGPWSTSARQLANRACKGQPRSPVSHRAVETPQCDQSPCSLPLNAFPFPHVSPARTRPASRTRRRERARAQGKRHPPLLLLHHLYAILSYLSYANPRSSSVLIYCMVRRAVSRFFLLHRRGKDCVTFSIYQSSPCLFVFIHSSVAKENHGNKKEIKDRGVEAFI